MTNADEQPKAATYLDRARAEATLEAAQRRFAGPRPRINGTLPTVEPIAAPEWMLGPAPPDEPALGYAVDELPDLEKVGPQ